MLLTDMSLPITAVVYLRWLLYKMGKVNTTAYTVVGVLLTLVFFLCRTVAGTRELCFMSTSTHKHEQHAQYVLSCRAEH